MIKQLFLSGLVLALGAGTGYAQKERLRGIKLEAEPLNTVNYDEASRAAKPKGSQQTPGSNQRNAIAGSYGTQIGRTYYDLQTNSASGNRIVRHADGTISATWNETCDPNTGPGYANRGAGYNYWNGTTWIHGATSSPREFVGTCNEPAGTNGPAFGINTKRTGWPEMLGINPGSGSVKEMVITHDLGALNQTNRTPKGTGGMAAWSTTTDLAFTMNVQATGNAGTWPRAVSDGNNIHMVYVLNKSGSTPPEPVINGVQNPMVYSRSTDGGVTWDKQNIFLPGMVGVRTPASTTAINTEGFNNIGGDGYAIAVRGNTVAIVSGYFGNAWTLWKSSDNGNTFTRRVISKITAADTAIVNAGADTVAFVNDNAHAIVIDNNNVVHVFAGEILTKIKTNAGGTIFTAGDSWYPNSGRQLLYWNDGMATGAKPTAIAGVEDSQPAGGPKDFVANAADTGKRTPYRTIGMLSMATAAVDAQNNVYVIYAGVVKGTTNNGVIGGQPFRDLYIKKRLANQGGKWSKSVNIARTIPNLFTTPGASTAENFEESVFPSAAHEVGSDNKVHFIFMSDFEPGNNVGPDADAELENSIMYYAFDANYWELNIAGSKSDLAAYVNQVSAYPNPTTSSVKIAVDLKQNAKVQIRVMNALGQEVARVAPTAMTAGKNEVAVDMANLAAGVYIYTVTSDNFTVTNRIVKN